ncbi:MULTISPECIES: gamma-glutamyl-gamma-aminobutyrate hydrolase family protein [unclassified Paenibacillus]|uniref:gamma-glutamyl-gamma-aminobutyrate hydrolase family protein n=1 Tax=unclassified Paenibacillus TaxID=185978 RepID=UPI0024076B96|nr:MULTISPECIES: gamma-glutamyl-gamma-aminobutyrate hydrolase family protein [unclassified Paenibacillus]MDF9839409.1 putative glutamine amidotransferase [Paenibacillus sp. PastF-2]MDF9845989.1 putative glutamine amidotransferase [Paenibacillus sp. PastM-2]MDF9852562.1 putative glutamine amidotransferase [Paenibacillus sp. PastF-1]MDH6477708.1 putative glutamine amidotransferase [Paenibacillus sp. PastH-2]MDH6505447.1 putative glutamine amidotransferase [Paenibacillus sp. PastM-3]
MKKPMIGVLPLYDSGKDSYWMLPGYMKAIENEGGIPVMLPLTTDKDNITALADRFDGFLFTGGHDINPKMYKETAEEFCGEWCDERDGMEKLLFDRAAELDKPAFGICRGLQLFNVISGGSLYQDIPAQMAAEIAVSHKQKPPYAEPSHSVHICKDTLLHNILQTEHIEVNSYHHQGIKTLAASLTAAAAAEDGLVEAVTMENKSFILAVQWHPEFSYTVDSNSRKLFSAFVNACHNSN